MMVLYLKRTHINIFNQTPFYSSAQVAQLTANMKVRIT